MVNHHVIPDELELADKLQLLVPEELSSDSSTNHYCVASKCPRAYRAIALLFSDTWLMTHFITIHMLVLETSLFPSSGLFRVPGQQAVPVR